MNVVRILGFVLFLGLLGCGSDEPEEVKPVSPDPAPDSVVSRNPKPDVPDLAYIPGSDRDASEIMRDFGQPISTLPVMDSNQSVLGQDGKVYFPDGEGGLFTGKLRELYPDGRPAFESSYLEGVPHGNQLRWHESGHLALESLFEDGRLVGMKTRWWPDGRKREEEYWSDGRFRGRRLWDSDGRLTREELVNF
ncbi:MAG: hypothetical protein HOB63_13840 [Opitutae bacterium]|nr:hypothetical protein [Opitutae bacterium]